MTLIREYKVGDIIEGEWLISRFSAHRTHRIPVRVRWMLEVISYCDARVIEVLDVRGDDRLGIDIEPIKAEYEGRIMTYTEMDTKPWDKCGREVHRQHLDSDPDTKSFRQSWTGK